MKFPFNSKEFLISPSKFKLRLQINDKENPKEIFFFILKLLLFSLNFNNLLKRNKKQKK